MPTKTESTMIMHIRVPLRLYERVKALAVKERRSASAQAVVAMEKGLEK